MVSSNSRRIISPTRLGRHTSAPSRPEVSEVRSLRPSRGGRGRRGACFAHALHQGVDPGGDGAEALLQSVQALGDPVAGTVRGA